MNTLNVFSDTYQHLIFGCAWTPDKIIYSMIKLPILPGSCADSSIDPEKTFDMDDLFNQPAYLPLDNVTCLDPVGPPDPHAYFETYACDWLYLPRDLY